MIVDLKNLAYLDEYYGGGGHFVNDGKPEIERKFLARWLGDDPEAVYIRQAYLLVDPPYELRLRLDAIGCVLTSKFGSGLTRVEQEVEVPAGIGNLLRRMAQHELTKLRSKIGPWDIDVYCGRLRGLVIAEVELESADAALPPLPEGLVLGKDVTGDSRYSNAALAAASQEVLDSLPLE